MSMLAYKKRVAIPQTEASSVIKILSNTHRYVIMKLLLNTKHDLCVHELAETIGLSQSATSHQLAYLEACGAVQATREGKTKCYKPTRSHLTQKIQKIIDSLK